MLATITVQDRLRNSFKAFPGFVLLVLRTYAYVSLFSIQSGLIKIEEVSRKEERRHNHKSHWR